MSAKNKQKKAAIKNHATGVKNNRFKNKSYCFGDGVGVLILYVKTSYFCVGKL